MLSLKEAVRLAISEVSEIFADQGISNIMLEEVEMADEKVWNITVGFDRPADAQDFSGQHPLSQGIMALARKGRKYKVVKIDKESGEVFSIKDRVSF